MSDSRFSRWMGPLGILIVVLIFVGFGPLGGNSPGENASGQRVAAYWNAHQAMGWASIYIVAVAIAGLILYFTHLRTVLRNASGQQLWPNAMFFSSIVMLGGFVVAGVFQSVVLLGAHNHEYAIVKFANFFSDNNELPIVFGIAAITLATGISILTNRSRPLPKRLGWYSLLVGVVSCAGPLAFFAFLFGFPIWLIATGFVIGVKARRNTLAPGDSSSTPTPEFART